MTRPTTTGKAQDLITFTRSTTGTALAKISYGEELVTNGTFDSGTTGWFTSPSGGVTGSVVNGEYNLNNTAGGGKGVTQVFKTQAGKTYKITATARKISGISAFLVAAQTNWGFSDNLAYASTTSSSNVELSVTFKAVDEESYVYLRSDAVGVTVFDNVSVKEVLYDRPDGTLQLFNHPINKPRIEYDAEGNCLGLLVEEARTNLVTQSEFASGYQHHYITLTRNQTASPDTNINAASAVPTAVNSEHYLEYVLSSPSSGTYTQSVFVKANGYSKVALTPVHIGADQGATSTAQFDLTEGTSTQSGSAVPYISNLGNGWYRIAITYTATGTVTNHRFRVQVLSDSYGYVWQANGADGIYVYGAQLETGSFPTSYIPTSGSAVTRSADVATLAVSEFGYNQDQGSVVVEAVMPPSVISEQFWILGSNTSSARWAYSNSVSPIVAAYDGERGFPAGSLQPNATQKMAIGTDQSTTIVCLDGVSGNQASTNGNISSLTTVFYFGGNSSTPVLNLNGHIKSVQYYPLRLSNAQLQALTV